MPCTALYDFISGSVNNELRILNCISKEKGRTSKSYEDPQ
jgi:hypothetical protein